VPAAETTALKTTTVYQAALRQNKRAKYLRHLGFIWGTELALTVFWQVLAPDWIITPQYKTANKSFGSVAK
jgi:hypothetical protein